MEDKHYFRVPFNNAFIGLSHRFQFEDKLEKLRDKINQLIVVRVWLNDHEMLDIDNTVSCLKSMSVNQVMDSELMVEYLPCT